MSADDTTLLYMIGFKAESRGATVNSEIIEVNTWVRLNKLSFISIRKKYITIISATLFRGYR